MGPIVMTGHKVGVPSLLIQHPETSPFGGHLPLSQRRNILHDPWNAFSSESGSCGAHQSHAVTTCSGLNPFPEYF